jgi:hypothetical protein
VEHTTADDAFHSVGSQGAIRFSGWRNGGTNGRTRGVGRGGRQSLYYAYSHWVVFMILVLVSTTASVLQADLPGATELRAF